MHANQTTCCSNQTCARAERPTPLGQRAAACLAVHGGTLSHGGAKCGLCGRWSRPPGAAAVTFERCRPVIRLLFLFLFLSHSSTYSPPLAASAPSGKRAAWKIHCLEVPFLHTPGLKVPHSAVGSNHNFVLLWVTFRISQFTSNINLFLSHRPHVE